MSLGSAEIRVSAHHPFRSAKAKERYLKLYDMRAKEWPVASETRMADTAYGPTFVRVSGSASTPPLVLLHGVSGNSLQWMPNIEALSKSFRVYAVDNIYDYGRSVYTRIIKNPDDYVVWLDELLGALGLRDSIHLMGLSYGSQRLLLILTAILRPSLIAVVVAVADRLQRGRARSRWSSAPSLLPAAGPRRPRPARRRSARFAPAP